MEFRLRNLSLCNVCCLKMYIFIFFLLFFFQYIGLMVAFVFVEVAIAIGAYTQKDQVGQ